MRKISKEHTTEFLEALSNNICQSVSDNLTNSIKVAQTVANDKFLMEVLANEELYGEELTGKRLQEFTYGLTETFSYSWVFIASEKTKGYYTDLGLHSIMDPENNPDDAWYKEFVESGKDYELTIGRDNDKDNVWSMFVDARIEDDNGELLGVCGMALEISNLQELISSYEEQYKISILFVDDKGHPQLESGKIEEPTGVNFSIPNKSDTDRITIDKSLNKPTYTITRYIEQLDWYMVIHDINPYDYTVDYLIILINIAIVVIVIIITVISLKKISDGAGTLYSDSYNDDMTGLYNRRAYDDTLSQLMNKDSLKNITIIVFDVNGLKRVNDTLGHAAGDELIKTAAKMINEHFGEYGYCFRTGGDEFVAILDKPIRDLRAITFKFEYEQAKWKGELVDGISISFGIVSGSDIDCSIDELIFHADEQMYKRKRKYYNNSENNRRKAE
jgi:diguanylate cyclase (GGDEF)-like protein